MVVDFIDYKSGVFDAGCHVGGIVHFGISIGNRRKIEARHRKI